MLVTIVLIRTGLYGTSTGTVSGSRSGPVLWRWCTVPTVVSRVASWLGLAAHVCTLPFYLSSGLVAPFWAIVVLLVLWAGLLSLAVRAVRGHSAWGLAVPFLAVGVWLGVMSAGEALLGWTP